MTSDGPAGAGSTSPWTVLAGAFLLNAAAGAYEIVPASVTPVAMESLGVGPVAAGWLVSVMFLTAVVASVPVGVALDRVDVDRLVAAATVTLVVAGLWGWQAAAAGDYDALFLSRILGGMAFVVIWNAGNVVVGAAFGAETRATAVGVFTASAPAGFALGQFSGPLVAEAVGWSAVFVVYGAPALLGLGVYLLGGGHDAGDADAPAPSLADLGDVLTDRGVWIVSILGFLAYALYLFVNSWLPTYMTETSTLTTAEIGLFVALFPAMGALSRTSGGVISDRLFGARRRPVALLSFAVTAPTFVAFVLTDDVVLLVGLLAVSGYFVQLGLGLFFSYVREIVAPTVASTAVSILTAVGLFGAFASPIGAGWLIDRTGSYPLAFGLATALTVVAVGLAWFAPRRSAAGG